MRLESVGEIIAERKLSVVGNPAIEVSVRMGKPQQLPDAVYGDQFCPVQIIGVGREQVKYAAGVDGFQAIELAMRLIGSELWLIKRDFGVQLRWDGDEKGDLGFPPITE